MVAAPQKPILLCIPAATSTVSDSDWNRPAPWPQGSTIRVKVLPNQVTHDIIVNIIKKTASQWLTGRAMGIGVNIQWVSEKENADVRISFRADQPSWSCVGTRAQGVDQSVPTMNFSFGNWKEDRTLYPHSHIIRAAAHLFGHALGLPHASAAWSSGWDDTQLATKYGQSIAARMSREAGCASLKRADSIMRFDRPASLTGGTDDLQGGSQIDDEARELISSLYPPFRDIFHTTLEAPSMPGFSRRDHSRRTTSGCGRQTISTPYTSNGVTGLCKLDIDKDDNARITSSILRVNPGSSIEVEQGSWSYTYLNTSHCQVLGFAESDTRFQTGTIVLSELLGGRNNESPGVGVPLDIRFPRTFRTTPNVVAWIAAFDTIKDRWIRIRVTVQAVRNNDFRVYVESWDNTILYNFRVYWLAHESDDPTIRTGTFNFSQHMNPNYTEDRGWATYSSPMTVKPRYMFTAFNVIDANPTKNIRLECQTPQWDQKGVEGRCSTWEQESAYCQLSSVYIAIA